MPLPRILLLAAAAFLPALAAIAAPDTTKLREQLALATTDGDHLSRIEILRRILDAEPNDGASHQLLISLWLEISDYDMAESALNAWPAATPDVTALTRAEVLRNRDQNLAGAIKVLDDYLAKFPQDKKAWEALVLCQQKANDHTALLTALDAYIALAPSATNLIRRANARIALGDYPGALTDAKAAQATEPDADIVKNSLPRFERLAETLQALPPLDVALQKDPKNFTALLERSWWFLYAGIFDRSLTDAESALAVEPASLMAKMAKFHALYGLGKVKSWEARDQEKIDVTKSVFLASVQAIADSDVALAKDPKDAAQFAKRAYQLNEAGQYLLARADVDHALALDPKATGAALEGIYALTMLGSDPAPIFRQLEQMKPTNSQLALADGYLAEMYFRQSNLLLALEFANRSLAREETERVLRVKASTLQRLDRAPEATEALQRADALKKEQP